jgi:hypothetical protein
MFVGPVSYQTPVAPLSVENSTDNIQNIGMVRAPFGKTDELFRFPYQFHIYHQYIQNTKHTMLRLFMLNTQGKSIIDE